MGRKGVVKERLICLGDYTGRHFEEDVALQLQRSLGIARLREGAGGGGDRPTPMAWGWSLAAA